MPQKEPSKKGKKHEGERAGGELRDELLEQVAGGMYKAPATFVTMAPPDPLASSSGPKPSTDDGTTTPIATGGDGGGTISKKLPDDGR